MKILKRLTALLCVTALCAAAFTACGKSTDCYAKYTEAEAKTNALKKYSAETSLSLDANFGDGTSMAVDSTTVMTADIENSRYIQNITTTYPDYGTSANLMFYHADGMTYYSDDNSSYKKADDDSSAMKSVSEVADFAIPEKALSGASCKTEDAKETITAKAEGEVMKNIATQFLGGIDSMTQTQNSYDISEVELELVIADGFLISLSIHYSASFDYNGNQAVAEVDMKVAYTDVSGSAEVTAPEGIEAFPTYDDYAASTTSADNSGDDLSEEDAAAIDAAFALFEDDHQTKVANYDELYAEACKKYGQDTMDSIISVITVFGSVQEK